MLIMRNYINTESDAALNMLWHIIAGVTLLCLIFRIRQLVDKVSKEKNN